VRKLPVEHDGVAPQRKTRADVLSCNGSLKEELCIRFCQELAPKQSELESHTIGAGGEGEEALNKLAGAWT